LAGDASWNLNNTRGEKWRSVVIGEEKALLVWEGVPFVFGLQERAACWSLDAKRGEAPEKKEEKVKFPRTEKGYT